MFYSTRAWVSSATGFEQRDGVWYETGTNAAFDAAGSRFTGGVARLDGFDTYWYSWSLIHPGTEVLK